MILEFILIILLLISVTLILRQHSNPLRWLTHSRPLTCRKDRHRHECMFCSHTKKCLHHLHKQAKWLHKYPEMSEEILHRLKYLLPSGIIFKQQRQRLYHLAHHIHKSPIPHSQNARLHYEINIRLQKLDSIASEQENRICNLHRIAESYAAVQHYTKLHHCVKAAIKLQHSNRKLLKNIHRTEKYLSGIFRKTGIRQT